MYNKNLAKVNNHPFGRQFAESGHPAANLHSDNSFFPLPTRLATPFKTAASKYAHPRAQWSLLLKKRKKFPFFVLLCFSLFVNDAPDYPFIFASAEFWESSCKAFPKLKGTACS
jgi:hypothetical protein